MATEQMSPEVSRRRSFGIVGQKYGRKTLEEENEYLKKENRRLQLLVSQLLERLTEEE